MAEIGPVLLMLVGVVVVGAIAVVGIRAEQKRRDRLMQYCVGRGWTYVGQDRSLVDRWQGEPFGRGDGRCTANVIRGNESGRPFTAFDYSYQTHSTDSQGRSSTTTHRYAVYVISIPAYLPRLEVTRENVLHRIAGAVGAVSDIDLESEDFNRAFQVRATDRKFATDVLSPRTMQFLLSARPGSWRIEGTDMIWWEDGRLDPADVVTATAVLDRVADGIPDFVWADHAVRPGYDPQT